MVKHIRNVLGLHFGDPEIQRLGLYVLFLPALASLAILVGAGVYLINWPYDGIAWWPATGIIEYVDPMGPAANLLQPGDTVTSLDGAHLDQITQLYAGKQAGDHVTYTISMEGGPERNVVITLARPSATLVISRLVPLFIALAFWAFGIAVLSFRPTDGIARLFFCFNMLGCSTLCSGALSATGLLWASRLFSPSLWLLASLTIHLHLCFPRRIMMPHRRLVVSSVYGVALAGILFDALEKWSWVIPMPGRSYAGRAYLFISFLSAGALLLYSYRHAISSQVRRQIRLVALGAMLALMPFSLFLLIPDVLLGHPFVPYNLAFFFLLAIPLAYGYAIVRYQLIQLDRTISRGLVHVILFISLVGTYLLLNAGLSHFLPNALWQQPWVDTLFILIVVTTFVPFRNGLQRMIDWIFYGGWYDYPIAIQRISRALEGAKDRHTLARRLLSELQATLKVECACLLLRGDDGNLLTQSVYPFCLSPQHALHYLESSHPLVKWLEHQQRPLAVNTLPVKEADFALVQPTLVSCGQSRSWVPLVGDGKLLGLFLLGRKQGDDPFDVLDLQILDMVGRQASTTVQNIILLQDLSKRAAEMEKLHQQLIQTREQERKRLARELHDEIIQSLVGLNYDISDLRAQGSFSSDEDVERLQNQLHQIMRDLRRVCSELRPPALDSLGLVSAVRSRLRDFENEGKLQAKLVVDGDDAIPSEEASVCLYRVLQEALANIQKHAQATRVKVTLVMHPNEIRLSIEDNGCGFYVPPQFSEFIRGGHFGLAGLRERMELIGGKLVVSSLRGQGTLLEARVPLKERQGVGR